MKRKSLVYILLGVIGLLLIGCSIYINFIAKSSAGLSYIVLFGLMIGIFGSIGFILLGNKYLTDKKDYHIMFSAFLILVFTFALSILNVVYGYKGVVNVNDYKEYMVYVSAHTNLYIYGLFTSVIGVLTLNMFINQKLRKEG